VCAVNYWLRRNQCIGGTDIPVCASASTGRNACAADSADVLPAQQSIIDRGQAACDNPKIEKESAMYPSNS